MNLELLIIRIPAILLALTIHEFAHGWIAYMKGDSTAKNAGRLTLNPIAHLDPFGALMLMFGPFGWAKPVPVNPRNFANPKRDNLLVSLAGPVSNIILALIIGYLYRGILAATGQAGMNSYLNSFFQLSILINLGIAFFNLIPVPPLDGSHILAGLLPNKWIPSYYEKMRYMPMVFMGMIIAEWALKIPIFSFLMNPLFRPFQQFFLFVIFGNDML